MRDNEANSAAVPPAQTDSHLYWVDLLRTIAVIQVVLVHAAYPVFFKYGEIPLFDWMAVNFYESASRMCVPLFFMASGVLLLGKFEPVGEFFRKRLGKVVVPTVIWTVIYLLWVEKAYLSGEMSLLAVVLSMLKTIYVDSTFLHLWFLYALIGIYLVVPVLRYYVSAAPFQNMVYFLVIWLIANTGFEYVAQLSGYQTTYSLPVVTGFVGYFVMGYAVRDVRLDRRSKWIGLFAILGSALATALGTYWLIRYEGHIDDFFYSYFSIFTVVMTLYAYLLIKDVKISSPRVRSVLNQIGSASFGIYLVHILVLESLRGKVFGFRLHGWLGPPVYMVPVTALVAFLISFAVVFVMRKIPLVKMLVP